MIRRLTYRGNHVPQRVTTRKRCCGYATSRLRVVTESNFGDFSICRLDAQPTKK